MDSPDKLVRVDVEMLSTPRLRSASVVTSVRSQETTSLDLVVPA